MTKRQEHIRRWLAAAGPRIVAVAATAGSLGLVCTALAATVNTVTVADSAGAQRTVMAAVTEPEVLLDLAGMELESNDSTRLHEVEDGTLLLSLQRAFPVSVAADGEYYEAEISDGTVADVLARAGQHVGHSAVADLRLVIFSIRRYRDRKSPLQRKQQRAVLHLVQTGAVVALQFHTRQVQQDLGLRHRSHHCALRTGGIRHSNRIHRSGQCRAHQPQAARRRRHRNDAGPGGGQPAPDMLLSLCHAKTPLVLRPHTGPHSQNKTDGPHQTARVSTKKNSAARVFENKNNGCMRQGQALVPVHYSKRKPPRQIFGFKPPFFYTIGNILRRFFLFCHPVQTLRARFPTAADIACFPLCKP